MTSITDSQVEGIELILALALMLALFGVFSLALLKASQVPHPGALVTALSLLTTLVIVAYVLTEAEALIGLAGAGIGALAGAVTATYVTNKEQDGHE